MNYPRIFMVIGVLVASSGFVYIFFSLLSLPRAYHGTSSTRINLFEPQDLPTTHPVYQEAMAEIKLHHHSYDLNRSEFIAFHGDLDGDGVYDTIKANGWPIMELSRSGKTYESSTSDLIALGMADIDRDGITDAWYFDPGDRYYRIIWGGVSGLNGYQQFPTYHMGNVDSAAFVDIDKDGDLDLIYSNYAVRKYQNKPARLYWQENVPFQEK